MLPCCVCVIEWKQKKKKKKKKKEGKRGKKGAKKGGQIIPDCAIPHAPIVLMPIWKQTASW